MNTKLFPAQYCFRRNLFVVSVPEVEPLPAVLSCAEMSEAFTAPVNELPPSSMLIAEFYPVCQEKDL